MARFRGKGRPCKFESLEQRNLLAGDVTASIHSGDLVIQGDNLANGITITAGATAGTVVITGIDAGGSATTINGGTAAVTITGFTDDLKVNMKGGDDSVSITDLSIPDDVELKGGDGNDTFTLDGVTIEDKVTISLGDGDDTLTITDSEATGKAEVEGNEGDDDVTIDGSTFTKLKVSLGHDDDTLDVSDTTVSAKTELNGGDDTNTFTNGTGNSLTKPKVKNFTETDDEDDGETTPPSVTAPTLVISGAATANEGSTYTLNLSSSGSGASSITKWSISWGDSSAAQVVNGNPSSVTHTWLDGAGTRTVSATATTPDGTFNASSTVAVTVGNVAPTLAISGPTNINEGGTYTLNLSSSDPGSDTITGWAITWGDGSVVQTVTGNPPSVTHIFADGPAVRTISATATDEDGTFNAGNTVSVTVNNVAPLLTISGATNVNEGALYTLNLSSTDAGSDAISQWTINWGDSTPVQTVTGNPPSVTHTFADGSVTRTINATATDEDSTFAASSTLAVIVNNVAPTLTISGPSSVAEHALYTLNLSSSDPGTETIVSWTIFWGDGSAPETVVGNPTSATHVFADGPATRTITAEATDEDGTFAASGNVVVSVGNVSPSLAISGASSVNEGEVYTLTLSSSDPGADTISKWTINWGDGTPVEEIVQQLATAIHVFNDGPANVTISATATDEDGTYTVANTVSVAIQNVAPTVSINGPTAVDEGTSTFWSFGPTFDQGTDQISEIIVHWGDGETESFPGGIVGLYLHTYEEGPNAYTITVDLVDGDGTYPGVASLDVTVSNVAPQVAINENILVDEGVAATLNAVYFDPDILDAQTVTVNWDDPNNAAASTFELPASLVLSVGDTFASTTDGAILTVTFLSSGSVGFSVQHTYLDDGVAPGDGIQSHGSDISVSVSDDDGGTGSATLTAYVYDVAATLQVDPLSEVTESGYLTYSGTYTDVGSLDAQTLSINWGDPATLAISTFAIPAIRDAAGPSILAVGQVIGSSTDGAALTIVSINSATGTVGFATSHQYLDDGPPLNDGFPVNYSTIQSVITGDDSLSRSDFRYFTIRNLAPTIVVDPVPDIAEDGTVTVTGRYTDAGLLDGQTLSINWADPNQYFSVATFGIPAIRDAAGTATLHVGDTFGSLNGSILTITSIDPLTGEVGFSAEHRYVDDGYASGNATASDQATITVTVTDDDGESASQSVTITVNNIAPTVSIDPVNGVSENSDFTLTGTYTDVGSYDYHVVKISWGDPNKETNSTFYLSPLASPYAFLPTLNVGSTIISYDDGSTLTITSIDLETRTVGFAVQHKYEDDGLYYGNDTSSDLYTVAVTVTDDDGASATALRFITVNNVAPSVSLDPISSVSEGSNATITGSFVDPGLRDLHTLTINWGDPNSTASSTFNILPLAPTNGYGPWNGYPLPSTEQNAFLTITSLDFSTGAIGFSIQHQYRDDGESPGNASDSDISRVFTTLTDDDGGSNSTSRFVTVNNSVPELTLNDVPLVFDGGDALLTGQYLDAGHLDAQTLTVEWGDSTPVSTFAIPAILDAAGNPTFQPGSAIFSSSDVAVLIVTAVDEVSGELSFSTSHHYTSAGMFGINVGILDDDGGLDAALTIASVNPNVA